MARNVVLTAITVLVCLPVFCFSDQIVSSSKPASPASRPSEKHQDDPAPRIDVKIEDLDGFNEALGAVRSLSDAELEARLDPAKTRSDSAEFDFCLTDMIRRGGPHWEQVLKAGLARRRAGQGLHRLGDGESELLILTALRRLQNKTDPVMILVEGKATIRARLGYVPTIVANVTNLDSDRAPVSIMLGGDYRGTPRHNKFRLQVSDSNGNAVRERDYPDMGGLGREETLAYGESIPARLEIEDYVMIDEPGEYSMIVMFHPELRIAQARATDGLLVCKSIPIKLVVEPITIQTTPAEQANVAALIARLPNSGIVRILGGSYGDGVKDFMPFDSPAAQIRRYEWNAVPTLIAAVNDEKLNSSQRAWALGLLFGITDRRNPMNAPGVVGSFEYRHSGWIKTGDLPGIGHAADTESISVPFGEIDVNKQIEFAKGWLPWIEKGYIKVKKTNVRSSR
jgi:hypothetical protein